FAVALKIVWSTAFRRNHRVNAELRTKARRRQNTEFVAALQIVAPLKPDSLNTLVCAVDLGGTNLRAAIVDSAGRIHNRAQVPTPDPDNAEKIVAAIVSAVSECHAGAGERASMIQAVSIVVPGSVHAETGLIVNAPNLPS